MKQCFLTVALVVLAAVCPCLALADIVCPPMPSQMTTLGHNVNSDIEASAGVLSKVKAAEIKIKTDVTVKSLFEKFPHVDRLTTLQVLSSTYCSILKDSSFSSKEKADRWEKFQERAFVFMN